MSKLKVVSFSELTTAHQCPLKHQLSYVDRWTKPLAPDDARYKGTYWHRAMEAHYNIIRAAQRDKQEPSAPACLDAAMDAIKRADPKIRDLVSWMYEGYVRHYGLDEGWRILAVEHSAQVRLPTLAGYASNFVLKLKIDLVVRDMTTPQHNILVVDHKGNKDLPTKTMLELDDQFGLYTWGMRRLGKKVFGQLHNSARTLRLKEDEKTPGATPLNERFKRTPLYRTDIELDEVAVEAYLTARSRYRELREVQAAGRMSPRYTDPRQCSWMCDYLEPCLASRKGMDIRRFLRDSGFRQDFSRH